MNKSLADSIFDAAVSQLRIESARVQNETLIRSGHDLVRMALHVIGGPDDEVDHRDWIKSARQFLEQTSHI